ncbi:S8 family serine peptidase [Pseudobacteriovorax antillogorgiicola]|uniref:Subtilase family protein n=1 Tax=Pseudobacteriovorax antillogorgiicola TaxID=1513793 RepID=A0A1Y6BJ99_9BACT|nr:S8 family serine peptidase [Pseudobacteriovorax antillogorgiicola]TCS56360.1 subtilase family protein [Pseudobacteriovorax antillogorgiicola]SMF06682.1 Subtilase family protein [Pseudobacteriovorax antillogorgiicola]
MRLALLTFMTSVLYSCHDSPSRPVAQALDLRPGESSRVIIVGDQGDVKDQADDLGLDHDGDEVVIIEGPNEDIGQIDLPPGASVIKDEPVEAVEREAFTVDEQAMFIAKKDFGLLPFWQQHPHSDGRGVVVGVIDDGISPFHGGFRETSDGKRKYIKHGSRSSAFTLTLKPSDDDDDDDIKVKGPATLKEEQDTDSGLRWIDVNGNGARDEYVVEVLADRENMVCIDISLNGAIEEPNECLRDFASSGDFLYWDTDKKINLMVDYDPGTGRVQFHQGESAGDSHGEGVASVMAGHRIGSQFSGVAPGAQILDYDISAQVFKAEEGIYSIGTFLKALEWMGKNGADVANISYSLYFLSPESQLFMSEAIDRIVTRYNMVVSFSAGNNGPGLGSMNRALIYPRSVLATGAFSSKELAENVHGITGLPEQGRVIRYSSRGPAVDGGSGPHVIAPLSSITHSTKGSGFRGFSGTSSASPAAAGFAAVLISHVKKLGLEFDASSIVAAVRQSARPIADSPFVEQGYGLPQIDEAVEIYKGMIQGRRFKNIQVRLSGAETLSIAQTGSLSFRSRQPGMEEFRIRLRGEASSLVSDDQQAEMLMPLTVEYSEPWITGPGRALVSLGSSYQYILVDPSQIPSPQPGHEYFGEVIYRAADGRVVTKVPVTYIWDHDLRESYQSDVMTIGSEEGVRRHLYIPSGVQGLVVRTDLLEGDRDRLGLTVYNPEGLRAGSVAMGGDTSFISVDQAGWYQLAVSRYGGTIRPYKLQIEVETVDLVLVNPALTNGDKSIWLKNQGHDLRGRLEVRPLPKVVESFYNRAPIHDKVHFHLPLDESGQFRLRVATLETSLSSYVRRHCNAYIYDKFGQFLDFKYFSSSRVIDVDETSQGGVAEVYCSSFEYTDGMEEAQDSLLWWLRRETVPATDKVLASGNFQVDELERSQVSLLWEEGQSEEIFDEVGIYITPHQGRPESIQIGTLPYLFY